MNALPTTALPYLFADGERNVPHEQLEPGEPLDGLRGVPHTLLGPILRVRVVEVEVVAEVVAVVDRVRKRGRTILTPSLVHSFGGGGGSCRVRSQTWK